MRIVKAIVHEIPKGRKAQDSVTGVGLSDDLLDLDTNTRRFIEDSMVGIALSKQRRIIEDDASQADLPDVVRSVLIDSGDRNFIAQSHRVADLLHQSQNHSSPAGILIVAEVVEQSEQKLLILKAEHQEGMRLRKTEVEGVHKIDLEHLKELIVGDNARVYKIALVHLSDGDDPIVLGRMVDQQNGVKFAGFFLKEFLGCTLQDAAEMQTKRFVDQAFEYLNTSIPDIQDQARYASALMAYIAQPSDEIDIKDFTETHLEAEDQDAFLHAIDPDLIDTVFNKDVRLLPGKATGMRYSASGVTVTASVSALESRVVEIEEQSDGTSIIKVNAIVEKLSLTRAPQGS